MEDGATVFEPVMDDGELDDPVPDILNVEGHLGSGFGAPDVSGGFVHADLDGPLGRDRVPGVTQPVEEIRLEDHLFGVAHDKPDLLVNHVVGNTDHL